MQEGARYTKRLEFDDSNLAGELFGPHNQNLARISDQSGVTIDSRGATLTMTSDSEEKVNAAAKLMAQLYGLIKSGRDVSAQDIDLGWRIVAKGGEAIDDIFGDVALAVSPKRKIHAKSANQKSYLAAMRESDLVFGVGPAGTGKTYLAVACAVDALEREQVRRILLVRPAVEAGEKLGFLPGDLAQKIDPYLRPLYDALYEMLGFEHVARLIEKQVIEIAPLAYMRGRTLNNSFIILDESQNTTQEQMKMFLTRIGFGSTAVITGDITQVDLPRGTKSGLTHVIEVLKDVNGISFTHFQPKDVVRHPLVQRIVEAYESFEGKQPQPGKRAAQEQAGD